ncbi:hypothetical protein JW964_00900 [candidate division KSB1 bacterium]|nr:hypothetical protein [candidate division KSB1 bacterium]
MIRHPYSPEQNFHEETRVHWHVFYRDASFRPGSFSRLSVNSLRKLLEFIDKTGISVHSAVLCKRTYHLAFCEDTGK